MQNAELRQTHYKKEATTRRASKADLPERICKIIIERLRRRRIGQIKRSKGVEKDRSVKQ